MQFGAVDDHARFTVIAHLVECKRAADHVTGETLTAIGIGGFSADAVVHGKTRVSPLAHALGEIGIEYAFCAQETQHLVAQRLPEHVFRQGRQQPKCARGQKHAIGNQGVNMRVERHEIAESLHVQDEGGLATRLHGPEAGLQESGDQPAELAKIAATVAEERPQQLRQREHVLAMRHGDEQRLLEPLAVGEHPFLMTARAEVAGLARVGQQVIVAALIAVDAGEALVKVAAGQESLEHLCFDGTGNELGVVEFLAVSREELFGKDGAEIRKSIRDATGEEELDQIEATVAEVRKSASGQAVITLDNGQVWLQTESTKARISVNDKVTIRRRSFGSYSLYNKKTAIRVKRIS